MAGKGIAELKRATSVTDTDLFITETAEGTRSIEYAKLKEPLQEEIDEKIDNTKEEIVGSIDEKIDGVKEEIESNINEITTNITNLETIVNENKIEIDNKINDIKISINEIKDNIIILTDKIADCNCSNGSGGNSSIIGDTLTPEDIICACYPLADQHDLLTYTPTYSASYDWKKLSDLSIAKAVNQSYMDAYVLYIKLPKDKFISNIIPKNKRHRYMDKPTFLGEYDDFNIYYMLCYVPYYETYEISEDANDNGGNHEVTSGTISPKFNLELSDTKRADYFRQNLKSENIKCHTGGMISNYLTNRSRHSGTTSCSYSFGDNNIYENQTGILNDYFGFVIDISGQYRLIDVSFDNPNTILEYVMVYAIYNGGIQYLFKVKNKVNDKDDNKSTQYDLNGTFVIEEKGFTF